MPLAVRMITNCVAEAMAHGEPLPPGVTRGLPRLSLKLSKQERGARVDIQASSSDIVIMSTMIAELYDALKSAGAPEDQARKAAEVVAGYENRFGRIEGDLTLLKWMVGL